MKYLAAALIFIGAVGGPVVSIILAPQWPWLAFGIAVVTVYTANAVIRDLMKS